MPTIEGTHTKTVKIEISEREFARLTVNHLYRIIGLIPIAECSRRSYFINGNSIYVNYEEGGGSHSWFTEEIVREATPLDIATFEVIRAIHQFANKAK